MKTCPLCEKGILKKKIVPYTVYGFKLGDFPAEACSSCGEPWFREEIAKRIEVEEKKRGLFGLAQKSRISYAGNSLIIRIPAALAQFLHIKREEEIIIHPEGERKIGIELIS